MSVASDCCACPTPVVTEIPGAPGENGAAGAAGADGVSAFTLTTEAEDVAALGASVAFSVAENTAFAIGQTIFVSDGTDWGTFQITGKTGSTVITATKLDAAGDTATPFNLASGSIVTAAGAPLVLASALPNAFTDNSTGTASDTIAAGVGKFTHSIFFRAAAITGNVLLYTYTPGFAFKIVRISASVVDAVTSGGASTATLTTAIAGTPTTGGVVVMSGAYALGAEQASSAAITGLNTGTSAQAVTVTASAVTVFTGGGFILHMEIQNMDTANAIASLSDHVNDLITSLT